MEDVYWDYEVPRNARIWVFDHIEIIARRRRPGESDDGTAKIFDYFKTVSEKVSKIMVNPTSKVSVVVTSYDGTVIQDMFKLPEYRNLDYGITFRGCVFQKSIIYKQTRKDVTVRNNLKSLILDNCNIWDGNNREVEELVIPAQFRKLKILACHTIKKLEIIALENIDIAEMDRLTSISAAPRLKNEFGVTSLKLLSCPKLETIICADNFYDECDKITFARLYKLNPTVYEDVASAIHKRLMLNTGKPFTNIITAANVDKSRFLKSLLQAKFMEKKLIIDRIFSQNMKIEGGARVEMVNDIFDMATDYKAESVKITRVATASAKSHKDNIEAEETLLQEYLPKSGISLHNLFLYYDQDELEMIPTTNKKARPTNPAVPREEESLFGCMIL